MADKYGRFTSNGDWSDGNNWSSTRYGATGAGAPASNDVVYLLDPPQFAITSGLSQGAVDLNGMTIGPDWNGQLGAPGSPLTIAVSGTSGATLSISGSGSVYITAGTNGVDIAKLQCRGAGKVWLTGGTFAQVENRSGDNESASGCTITTLYNLGRFMLKAGGTTTTVFNTGTLLSEVNLTTLHNDGTARGINAVTITTLNNRSDYTHQSSGTITTANCYPGSIAKALAPFTATTVNEWFGSQAFREQGVTVTVGTRNQIGW